MKNNRNPNIKKPVEILSLDQLLSKAEGSVFLLARIAMIRALEIHFGSPPLMEHLSSDKETTIALQEVAHGRIVLKNSNLKQEMNEEISNEDVQIGSAELEKNKLTRTKQNKIPNKN